MSRIQVVGILAFAVVAVFVLLYSSNSLNFPSSQNRDVNWQQEKLQEWSKIKSQQHSESTRPHLISPAPVAKKHHHHPPPAVSPSSSAAYPRSISPAPVAKKHQHQHHHPPPAVSPSPSAASSPSPSMSPKSIISPIIPGPCLPSNDDYRHRDVDFKTISLSEIESARSDWQQWYIKESPKHTFSNASSFMSSHGLPAMKGRGIAIVIGDPNHINFLNTSITLLRKYGCNLPIEVWSFSHELSIDHKNEILGNSKPGAEVTIRVADDPNNYLPLERGSGAGYHVKVSVIINSGFEEVLFMDVDTMVIVNPEYLFTTKEYKSNAALFWPDYWKTEIHNPVWGWFGQPCVDEFEQESGIMVVNKKKSWKALMLLWYVNRNDEIRAWHAKFLHGDKDLFRFTFRAANVDVYFVQHLVSPGGFLVREHDDGTGELKFCGVAMMQFDPKGELLFAHANFFKQTDKRKFTDENPPLKVVKRYKPIEGKEPPGPIPGSKLAWYNARGSKAGFVGAGGYVCVDIFEGEERDGVVRKTEILSIKDRNPDFAGDLFKLLVEDWVKIDKANYEAEQKRKQNENNG